MLQVRRRWWRERLLNIEDDVFPDDALDEAEASLADWRDIAMKVDPVNIEAHAPKRGANPYKRPMMACNVSKMMRRRATVAAAELGISKDAWLRLLIAQALHAQLGDDIDELLRGTPKIIRFESVRSHVYD